ncbi:MAG: hypothetical protein ACMZ66_17990 [Thalassospira sp.]|uniref:hypothetical protein n=1 Tax=Thalassospira sp. TaxID=1912094 RepID=UPI003A8BD5B9
MENVFLNRAMALLAFIVLAVSICTLVFYVPRWDLAIMVGFTLILAGWDMWHVAMGHKEDKH